VQQPSAWTLRDPSTYIPYGDALSPNANGAYCTKPLALNAHKYLLKWTQYRSTNLGKVEVWLDATLLQTYDEYAGAIGGAGEVTLDIGEMTAGAHTLKFLCNGKNAASSGYQISAGRISIARYL
jgi:hypothetical protein